ALPGAEHRGRHPAGLRRGAAAHPRGQPGRPRAPVPGDRAPARQEAGRPPRLGAGGCRPADRVAGGPARPGDRWRGAGGGGALRLLPPARPPPPRATRRRWLWAAAALVLLLAGLGLTEATGATDVRGTVIRLFSPDGTLVVEVDDPGVSVTVDGGD